MLPRIDLRGPTGRSVRLLIDLGRDEIVNLVMGEKFGYRGSLSERRDRLDRRRVA